MVSSLPQAGGLLVFVSVFAAVSCMIHPWVCGCSECVRYCILYDPCRVLLYSINLSPRLSCPSAPVWVNHLINSFLF